MLTAKMFSVDEACADMAIGAYCTTAVFSGVSEGVVRLVGVVSEQWVTSSLKGSTYFACHVELLMSLVFL